MVIKFQEDENHNYNDLRRERRVISHDHLIIYHNIRKIVLCLNIYLSLLRLCIYTNSNIYFLKTYQQFLVIGKDVLDFYTMLARPFGIGFISSVPSLWSDVLHNLLPQWEQMELIGAVTLYSKSVIKQHNLNTEEWKLYRHQISRTYL